MAPDRSAPNMFDMEPNCIRITSFLRVDIEFTQGVASRHIGAGAKPADRNSFPAQLFDALDLGLVCSEKIILLTLLPKHFQVRPAEHRGDHGSPAQRRDVDVAGDGDLSQLSGAGNEDDLVFQTFFGENPAVMATQIPV